MLKIYFGIKKDAYDRAMKVLQEKGYLVAAEGSNIYNFYELPKNVVGKSNNENNENLNRCGEKQQHVVGKNHNALLEKTTRNITDNTFNNTMCEASPHVATSSLQEQKVIEVDWTGEEVKPAKKAAVGKPAAELFHF